MVGVAETYEQQKRWDGMKKKRETNDEVISNDMINTDR